MTTSLEVVRAANPDASEDYANHILWGRTPYPFGRVGARELYKAASGFTRAMDQSAHEAWNASNYPGTRQLCSECEQPTGRCEEDSIYADDDCEVGPLCEDCRDRLQTDTGEQP